MRVVVATDARLYVDTNGDVWSDTGEYGYTFWARYLEVFTEVQVVARIYPRDGRTLAARVEGPGISVRGLPGYSSVAEFFLNQWKMRARLKSVVNQNAVYIARVPGLIGTLLIRELQSVNKPFALEVVGDPYDVFSPGASRHRLRRLYRWWFSRQLRTQCREASATAYVTEFALQRRYPPSPHVFSTHYSSVELPDAAFVPCPRPFRNKVGSRLISVGSMNHFYKAQDILIRAVELLVTQGFNVELILVGDGRYRNVHEHYVRSKGLSNRVLFTGMLPAGEAVRQQLDRADIFVLPSRQEGLPRAMIEAMARALPCIGSTVGGIPELLDEEYLVPPNTVEGLAERIRGIITSTERMRLMSEQNLARAQAYREENLKKRRSEFYREVKKLARYSS